MEGIFKHKKGNRNLWAAQLLGLLLIIAPCSVRNFLQHELGVKPTKTLNPPKKTIEQSGDCCTIFNRAETVNARDVGHQLSFKSFAPLADQFSSARIGHSSFFRLLAAQNTTHQNIPLYILYKRLKYMI
jgi:hypothetical protein